MRRSLDDCAARILSTAPESPLSDAPLIACPECDLLQSEIALPATETAACRRCGVELYRGSSDSLDRVLALTLAAVVLLIVANAMPIASLDLRDPTAPPPATRIL